MKKTTLLKSMLLLCALIAGNGNVWAQSGPDLSKFTWGKVVVDENFESTTVNSANETKSSVTNYTAMGAFNGVYNNDTNNAYGIENTVFGSKGMFLYEKTTKPVITAITGKTFGTTGAFSCKVAKTNKGYFGIYAEGVNGNVFSHTKGSVYLFINNGTVSITNGASSGGSSRWKSAGSYSTDIIEVFVIYNNTESPVTYGDGVSLSAKSAHVFVNGSCVMDGASPKAFTIPGATLSSFRATTTGTADDNLNLDDLKIYSGLPTVPITISAAEWASFSNANEVAIPSGLTAYYASSGNSTSVTLKEIAGGYIPANTGVVLHGTADTYYTTKTTTSASLGAENLLQPWLTAGEPTEGTYYVLGVDAGNPVFKQSTGGTLAAGKSYLVLSGGAHELTIDIENGSETTGIQHVTSEKRATEGYFNLAGQRVAQPTKGLYIVNGKKVIIK